MTADGHGSTAAPGEGLDRSDVFVTTKLWPLAEERAKTAEETLRSIDESLDRLGLEQVDLYLTHAAFGRQRRLEQWQGLVEAYKCGRASAIGMSNFDAAHVDELARSSTSRSSPAARNTSMPWPPPCSRAGSTRASPPPTYATSQLSPRPWTR
ncbi:aldo/keto reductase [Streptomyces sp. NPDC013178]|uniref:aldo/keto reductase n=1 Tax=Streptomyces sp. NPDC013178 TaxID=3155118 RepID=UPI0033FC08A0